MSPEAAQASCRFVHDAALMLVWGSSGTLAFLVPAKLARDIEQRLSVARVAAVLLAVVTLLAALPIETATIGDGWTDAVNPAMVRSVLIETSVGRAWVVRLAAGTLLAATLTLRARLQASLTAVASALALASVGTQGHAVMQEGWTGVAHQLNDAIHVLAAGAWLGSLVPVLFVLRALDDAAMRGPAGTALRRFSTAGHGAVVLVVATGIANTALTLGRWPSDWSSPYQALLAGKIGLVALMIVVAVVNRYGLVPRLQRRRGAALDALRVATAGEVVLGLVAVALVSVFGLLEPV